MASCISLYPWVKFQQDLDSVFTTVISVWRCEQRVEVEPGFSKSEVEVNENNTQHS